MYGLYGNRTTLEMLKTTLAGGRASHSYLIHGDKGVGKKTLAAGIASELTGCTNVHAHPDVIWAQHEGKLGGFKVEYVRSLLTDAFILPNNADRKVYIFTDCDNMNAFAQNALLKVVEEPPEFTYFIFTVSNRDNILPTILSRVISIGLSECSDEECRTALAEKDYSPEEIEDAVSAFHGNVGMCMAYLSDEALKNSTQTARNIAMSLAQGNEYGLLKAFGEAESDRAYLKNVIVMLDKIVRDASAFRYGGRMIGCSYEAAKTLSGKYTIKQLDSIHNILTETVSELGKNVGISIETASLCGRIFDGK